MQKLKEAIARFMYGRYGVDQLGKHINYGFIVCWLIGLLLRSSVFYYLSFALIIWAYFRMFSKNYAKRSAENQAYLRWLYGVKNTFTNAKKQAADKEHRYFRCPQCKQKIRVPKGKGKIEIKCPKCQNKFIKKS